MPPRFSLALWMSIVSNLSVTASDFKKMRLREVTLIQIELSASVHPTKEMENHKA